MESIWTEPCIYAPSLITLDLCNLEHDVRALESGGIRMLHVDILDGHFSPSMPLGLDTVRQLRSITDLPFDCHIMATSNDFFVNELLDIGVQQIVFHAETEPHIDAMLNRIHAAGVRAGVALRPATSLSVLDYAVEKCDTVLLMLINPGYASQKSEQQVPYAAKKIADLRARIVRDGLPTLIELDGRISRENIEKWHDLASLFVLGSTCIQRANLAGSLREMEDLHSRLASEKQ